LVAGSSLLKAPACHRRRIALGDGGLLDVWSYHFDDLQDIKRKQGFSEFLKFGSHVQLLLF
jgi:hypothetical protein